MASYARSETASPPGGAYSPQDAWHILELATIHYADKIAVIDYGEDNSLTYSQLHSRAVTLAAWLKQQNIRRGDRIAVMCRNSSHVMELHFAAAAIHAVIVNLNIHLAPAELAYIILDSKPKLIFADMAYAANLTAACRQLQDAGSLPVDKFVWVDVDTHSRGLSTHSEDFATIDYAICFTASQTTPELSGICKEVMAEGSADDGYHMYYTSGTTGRPKAVVLSHRIVVQHAVGTVKGKLFFHAPVCLENCAHRMNVIPAHYNVPFYAEMNLNMHDIWAHLAPMFHLVDVFAVYAITLVGGRHVTLKSFNPTEALLLLGKILEQQELKYVFECHKRRSMQLLDVCRA